MSDSIVEVVGLTKKYNNKNVVDQISFSIEKGDIVGLVGPNGSGKSTTMKMIMMLIKKDEGKVLFSKDIKYFTKKIGFATESSSFYTYMTGRENLKVIADLYSGISDTKIDELLEMFDIREAADRKVKTYSTGMKQRLGLARAFLNDPELLILDEPTNGLDPYGMKDVYEILEKMAKKKDVAILISSHLLHDIQKICNKVIMIQEGKTIFNGKTDELKDGLEESYYELFKRA